MRGVKLVWFTAATRRLPRIHTTVLLLPGCPRQNLRHHCGMHCPAAVMKFSNNLQQTRQEKDSGESNTHKQSDSLRVMQHLSSTKEIHYFWLLKPQPLTRLCLKQILKGIFHTSTSGLFLAPLKTWPQYHLTISWTRPALHKQVFLFNSFKICYLQSDDCSHLSSLLGTGNNTDTTYICNTIHRIWSGRAKRTGLLLRFFSISPLLHRAN